MEREIYRFEFSETVPLERVEETLCLSALAAEGVYGRSHLRLNAAFRLDKTKRTCTVDAGTEVGETLARILTGLLTEEFGEEAYRVERVVQSIESQPGKGEA
ncbi:MAG: hypothetical protein ABIH26_08325 [Candidatus Eisenbacteria bacterium]